MAAIPLAAAGVSALGSAIGGITGGKGAKKAAKIAAQSTQDQIAAVNQNRDYQYNLNAPTIAHGGAADDRIAALLNLGGDNTAAQAGFDAFRGSDGYDWRTSQGLSAINQHGFAGGSGQSGATLKAGINYNQNAASDEFLRYLQELGGVSATGAGARSLVAGVGNNATNQLLSASQTGANNQIAVSNTQSTNLESLLQNLANTGTYALGSSYGNNNNQPKYDPATAWYKQSVGGF